MLACRFFTEAHPRCRRGHPAQSTTGVDRIAWAQRAPGCIRACCNAGQGSISPMAIRKIGIVGTSPNQKRRVMSTSSAFGASSRVTKRGSSAMPQIGQDPGASRTISGCMGQTYSVFVEGRAGSSGSSAMPHLGQGTGRSSRTSGSMGQTQTVPAGAADGEGPGAWVACVPPCGWAAPAAACLARNGSGSATKRSRQRGLQNQ